MRHQLLSLQSINYSHCKIKSIQRALFLQCCLFFHLLLLYPPFIILFAFLMFSSLLLFTRFVPSSLLVSLNTSNSFTLTQKLYFPVIHLVNRHCQTSKPISQLNGRLFHLLLNSGDLNRFDRLGLVHLAVIIQKSLPKTVIDLLFYPLQTQLLYNLL